MKRPQLPRSAGKNTSGNNPPEPRPAQPAQTRASHGGQNLPGQVSAYPTVGAHRPGRPGRNRERPGQKTRPKTASKTGPQTGQHPVVTATEMGRGPSQTVGARLLLVGVIVLVIFVVIFTPLRNWMELRTQAQELSLQVQQARAENAQLKGQLKRWDDPDYVASQARSRLGYVRKGETTYILVDPPKNAKSRENNPARDLKAPWFTIIARSTLEASKPVPTHPGGTTDAPQ